MIDEQTAAQPDARTMRLMQGLTPETITPSMVRRLVESGLDRLEPFRQQRTRGVQLVLGEHYGKSPSSAMEGESRKKRKIEESDYRQPTNLGFQNLRTLLTYLAYSGGDPDFQAKFSHLEWSARLMSSACREDMKRLDADELIREVVSEMYFAGLAAVKVGVRAGAHVLSPGKSTTDFNEFYFVPISFDDLVIDPKARVLRERRFIGYRNRISRSQAIRANLYGRDPEEIDGEVVPPNPHLATRQEAMDILLDLDHVRTPGDAGAMLAKETDSRSEQDTEDDDDEIVVFEVEWNFDGVMYTIVVPACSLDGEPEDEDKFLMIQRADVPDEGSIILLHAIPAIDNIMPLSLEQTQRDLSIVQNTLAKKLVRQALASKRVPFYEKSERDAVLMAARSGDGEPIPCSNPDKIKEVQFGGMTRDVAEAFNFFQNLWRNETNDSALASGTATAGGTATEYQGQLARVEGWMQFLQKGMQTFWAKVYRQWAWYKLTDDNLNQVVPLQIAAGLVIPMRFTQETVEGHWLDFEYTPRAGSTKFMDPVLEANIITQFVSQSLPKMVQAVAMGALKPQAIRYVLAQIGVRNVDQIVGDVELMAQQMMTHQAGPQAVGMARGFEQQQQGQNQPGTATGNAMDARQSVSASARAPSQPR